MAEQPRDRRDQDRPYLRVGRFLTNARRDADLTRQQVIDRLQGTKPVSYPMLANLESGRRRLSDDLLAHLAPALGLTEDALRVVRDETDETVNRDVAPVDPARRLREARNRLAHARTDLADPAVARLYDQILRQSQDLDALSRAVAGSGARDFDGRGARIAALVTDLRTLDEPALDQVHAFIKGMLAAQGRQATAVDPMASEPLIRVPEAPFGPRHTWTLPEWMESLPGTTQALAEARELGDRFPYFEQRAEQPRSIGRRIADHLLTAATTGSHPIDYSWPALGTLAAAAEVGVQLRPRIRRERGLVSTYDWIRFISYMPAARSVRKSDYLVVQWVTRMVFVAGVTRGPSTHAVDSFIEECLPQARELTGRARAPAQRPPFAIEGTAEDIGLLKLEGGRATTETDGRPELEG